MKRDPSGSWSRSAWCNLFSMRKHARQFIEAYNRLPGYAKARLHQEMPEIGNYIRLTESTYSMLRLCTAAHRPEEVKNAARFL